MPELQVNLIKGDKISSRLEYRDALPVNMYTVHREALGARGFLRTWPGLTKFAESDGPTRSAVFNDRVNEHFRVSGTQLVKVDASGNLTDLGRVPGAKQASMPYSFNTQCVIADGGMFLYDEENGFRQVRDSDLKRPLDGIWVDGYYFLTDGEYIYHTDITDESSIDPLKYATAEFMPDKSLAVGKTQDDKVIVFGRHSIEYFVNAATPQFAFKRLETRAQNIGIVATHAKVENKGVWYIIGGRRNEALGFYAVEVGGALKLSTRKVDEVLNQYSDADLVDVRVESLVDRGESFIILHLPNETLCFSTSVAQVFGTEFAWLELQSENREPYRGLNGVLDSRVNRWVYGDKYAAQLGLLDYDSFAQYGEPAGWELYTPFLNLETFSIDELRVETLPGYTVNDDATVAISLTQDGQNYGSEWWNLYGAPLQYNHRFIIRRLGYVPHWVGLRLRGLTTSHMAFAGLVVSYG